MADQPSKNTADEIGDLQSKEPTSQVDGLTQETAKLAKTRSKKGHKSKRHSKRKINSKDSNSKNNLTNKERVTADSESSESHSDEGDSDLATESSDSSSEDEKDKRRARKRDSKRRKARGKDKSKHTDTLSSSESPDESSDSDKEHSDSDQTEDEKQGRSRQKKRHRQKQTGEEEEDPSDDTGDEQTDPSDRIQLLQDQINQLVWHWQQTKHTVPSSPYFDAFNMSQLRNQVLSTVKKASRKPKSKPKTKKKNSKSKKASTLEYKRVDELWDSSIHNYKLTESAEDQQEQFDEFVFTVRRQFDWENKYQCTTVDIKSKILREALQEVMKDAKGVSLVEDQPSIDPNMLFLYLEELSIYAKKTLKAKLKAERKHKAKKRIQTMISQCKLMIKYINKDYAETKKTLYPMLEAGNITFDLIWALFKPNTLAFTTTYGSTEDPRCFKVDYATKDCSFMRGEWYVIEGRYLEYDGKHFGLGDFEVDIDSFKGPRKITSLTTYPLKYHKDPEGMKKQLVERGKRFVSMEGMNYRFHKGLAFAKRKKMVARVNINGRIMVDPAIFRRINPNYPISIIKSKQRDGYGSEDSDCSSCAEDESDDAVDSEAEDDREPRETKLIVIKDRLDKYRVVEVPVDADGHALPVQNIDKLAQSEDPAEQREFTEEELVIASPVVLGFAFSEKLWLEFSIRGLCDIEWNEGAFESLVLPPNQKSIVKALVESHKFHAAKTIDDVVQGKGKGLVAVLHGPPGTGKTLTAEGIAELLRCPLYMVSAGELGTDPKNLEGELQKLLDIGHSWGAVLLLDEADVFLEKREVHDLHRNALVSIFLRLLEYFQGILFLTTNRVETFDDAFQSRIHVALRYGELSTKAKRAVWQMFLERVAAMEHVETEVWTESDFDTLARKNLNGRQIKNAVRTAQALAVNTQEKLSMEHIKRVLDVAESFEQDLKGGSGYQDAMRSYT